MPSLEQWAVVGSFDPYTAPELQRKRLHGIVRGHPNFPDGETITTSSIAQVEGEEVITSSGSRYTLGDPAPAYEELYPGARERVLKGSL